MSERMQVFIRRSSRFFRKYYAALSVFFIVALCLGLEWWWSRPHGKQRGVCAALQAQTAIQTGEVVTSRQVQIRFVAEPAERQRCEHIYFTESQLDTLNWVAARPLVPGQTLYSQDVQIARTPRLPRGKRAFAAGFESDIAVRPGQFVEVYSRHSQERVLGPSLVLEVSKAIPLKLVLALRPTEIRAMEKASRQGTLSVALVHPEDVRSFSSENRAQRRSGRVKLRPASARVWNEE